MNLGHAVAVVGKGDMCKPVGFQSVRGFLSVTAGSSRNQIAFSGVVVRQLQFQQSSQIKQTAVVGIARGPYIHLHAESLLEVGVKSLGSDVPVHTAFAAVQSQRVEWRMSLGGGRGCHLYLDALYGELAAGIGHRTSDNTRAAHETVRHLAGEHLVRPVGACHDGIDVIVASQSRIVVVGVSRTALGAHQTF